MRLKQAQELDKAVAEYNRRCWLLVHETRDRVFVQIKYPDLKVHTVAIRMEEIVSAVDSYFHEMAALNYTAGARSRV